MENSGLGTKSPPPAEIWSINLMRLRDGHCQLGGGGQDSVLNFWLHFSEGTTSLYSNFEKYSSNSNITSSDIRWP